VVPSAFPNCTENMNIEMLANISLFYAPYTVPHYSNLGIALLGRCIERAVGMQYEKFLQQYLFQPLGMTNTGFQPTASTIMNFTLGYFLEAPNSSLPSRYYVYHGCGWSNPAAGAFSSTSDLSKFFMAMFRNDSILSKARWHEYLLPGIPFADGTTGFGLATWEPAYDTFSGMNKTWRYWVQTKGGVIGPYGSQTAFIPQLKLAVISQNNINSEILPSKYTAIAMQAIVPALLLELEKMQTDPPAPPNYQQFFGYYGLPENGPYVWMVNVTSTPGVFTGGIIGVAEPLLFVWDRTQDYDGWTAMRYVISDFDRVSCPTRNSLGSDAVLYFKMVDGKPIVSATDQPGSSWWNMPRLSQ